MACGDLFNSLLRGAVAGVDGELGEQCVGGMTHEVLVDVHGRADQFGMQVIAALAKNLDGLVGVGGWEEQDDGIRRERLLHAGEEGRIFVDGVAGAEVDDAGFAFGGDVREQALDGVGLERFPVRDHRCEAAALVGFFFACMVVADLAVVVPADVVHADPPDGPALGEQPGDRAFAGVHGADEDEGGVHWLITIVSMAEDSESECIEPSLFAKGFSLVGAFIAISVMAAIIGFVLIAVNKWHRHEYSIYGLTWGVCARLFEMSVRAGIKNTLASPHLTIQKRKILGEQLTMLRITRWFVHLELIASGIALVVEVMR